MSSDNERVPSKSSRTEVDAFLAKVAATLFAPNQRFLDYLLHRIEALPIDVRLGQPATEAMVRTLAPDVLVALPHLFRNVPPAFVYRCRK